MVVAHLGVLAFATETIVSKGNLFLHVLASRTTPLFGLIIATTVVVARSTLATIIPVVIGTATPFRLVV